MFQVGVRRNLWSLLLILIVLGFSAAVVCQQNSGSSDSAQSPAQPAAQGSAQTAPASSQGQAQQQADPLKRPMSEKQKRENAKSLK